MPPEKEEKHYNIRAMEVMIVIILMIATFFSCYMLYANAMDNEEYVGELINYEIIDSRDSTRIEVKFVFWDDNATESKILFIDCYELSILQNTKLPRYVRLQYSKSDRVLAAIDML